jgi:hypothetical protein
VVSASRCRSILPPCHSPPSNRAYRLYKKLPNSLLSSPKFKRKPYLEQFPVNVFPLESIKKKSRPTSFHLTSPLENSLKKIAQKKTNRPRRCGIQPMPGKHWLEAAHPTNQSENLYPI